MVKLGDLQQVEDGTGAAGFGVHAGDHYAGNPGLYDGSGAHLARFKGHIHRTFLQPPVAQHTAGLANGIEFGMGQSIFICISAVVAAGDHFIMVYDHTANRHFIQLFSFSGLGHGLSHIAFICCHFIFLHTFCVLLI